MSKLCEIKPGHTARVLMINGGKFVQFRLAEMGLLHGEKITMIHNQGQGPVTIDIKGSRLSLGHGISDKILVREI